MPLARCSLSGVLVSAQMGSKEEPQRGKNAESHGECLEAGADLSREGPPPSQLPAPHQLNTS